MKTLLSLVALLAFSFHSYASVIYSNQAVVTNTTNTATFDSLNTNNIDLSTYAEDGVSVTVPDVSYVGFMPFESGVISTQMHYGSGGNNSWVTIEMLDESLIYALDFRLGAGWDFSPNQLNLLWEAFDGTVSVGLGDVLVDRGTTVGFTSQTGFTSLRVAASVISDMVVFGNYQAIALDDLRVNTQASLVNTPATLGLLSIFMMLLLRRK